MLRPDLRWLRSPRGVRGMRRADEGRSAPKPHPIGRANGKTIGRRSGGTREAVGEARSVGEMGSVLLDIRNVTKDFPGTRALDDVCMQVIQGEIHGLCGENGAGKSTLMKILSGTHPCGSYEGEILFDGEPIRFAGIRDSEARGIRIIHQEMALVKEMTVTENIFLGAEKARFGIIDQMRMYSETRELLGRFGLNVPGSALVGTLGVGQQQMVEIAKALRGHVRLLILDEPTSALNDAEVENLMRTLRELKAAGVTCIYISHKLRELFDIADRITVLRDGRCIGTSPTTEVTEDEIIAMMVGRAPTGRFPPKTRKAGKVMMSVRNWTVKDPENRELYAVRDVSFDVRAGEILGISGLMGSGRTELLQSLFGEYGFQPSGEIEIEGKKSRIRSARDAIALGMGLVTEDRKNTGLILMHSVTHNITLPSLPNLCNGPVVDTVSELAATLEIIKELSIKVPSVESKVETLSGGNQQKVSIGKWLMTKPRILMLDEPTRGIDVGTKYQVYELMDRLAAAGIAIIMASSDLPEVLGMSDRVLVMHEGAMAGIVDSSEANPERIMSLATIGKGMRNSGRCTAGKE